MSSAPQRHQLFICYSRADREWVDLLKKMLSPLLRSDQLKLWDDSQIPPGARWQEEIACGLATAKVALLLVSMDFLHSDFVNNEELPSILRAAEEEGVVLLWVKVRECLVHRTAIHAFQAAIDPARPLAAMTTWEQEEALAKVAEAIDGAFQRARERDAHQQALNEASEQDAPAQEAEKAARENAEQERAAILRQEEERTARLRQEREREAEEKTAQARAQANLQPTQAAQLSGLMRQLLPAGETAELVGGQGQWRVETHSLSVWGVVEPLAPGVELQLVEIPAGRCSIGSPPQEEGREAYRNYPEEWKRLSAVDGMDVEAQRLVTVPSFWLGRFAITQAQWQVVAGWPQLDRPLDPDPARFKGADRPVEQVSWHDALEFCQRLSQGTGRVYTLPSEAQWEVACRAGTPTPFHVGPTLSPELANYRGNLSYASGPKGEFREHTTPVGSFPANAWGLHDMHGNVWEWCLDRWHPSPRHGPSDGRPWLEPAEGLSPEGQELRLLRGGSWRSGPHVCRSASRDGRRPVSLSSNVGFRVCSLPPGSPPWPLSPTAVRKPDG